MKNSTSKVDIITKIDPFDFQRAFFSDKELYSRISDKAKVANAFRLFRTLSINMPAKVHEFQKIHTAEMIDYLHTLLYRGYMPKWVYTKTLKFDDDTKANLNDYSVELKQQYAKMNNIEYKSLEDAFEMWPDKIIKELKELQIVLEQKVKSRKRK